ncbi:hypothetical protein AAC387_Pa02g4899 [Persea americana]
MLRGSKAIKTQTALHLLPFNDSIQNLYAAFSLLVGGGSHRTPEDPHKRFQTAVSPSAHQLLDEMPQRDMYVPNATHSRVLYLLRWSLHKPDLIPINALHCLAMKTGSLSDISSSTSLLTGYARAGDLSSSWSVFGGIVTKDVICWNAMISVNVQYGRFLAAIRLFGEMMKDVKEFDSTTLLVVLSALSRSHNFEQGRVLHGISLKLKMDSNSFLGNALVDMYAKYGDLSSAESLFGNMEFRDAASWNSMMSGYLYNGYPEKSLCYFRKMVFSGVHPDSVSLSCVISACSCLGEVRFGEYVHGWATKSGYDGTSHVSVANALISFYSKCDSVNAAEKVFGGLIDKDVVSWNAMIDCLVESGSVLEAVVLLRKMQLHREVQPDSVTVVVILPVCAELSLLREGKSLHGFALRRELEFALSVTNSVMDMYMKCDGLRYAEHLFKVMPCRDLVSWNTMIAGYSSNGCLKEAQSLFRELLRSGLRCSSSTVLAILPSCSCHEGLQFGNSIHCWMLKSGFSNASAVNALLLVYINYRDMVASFSLFWSISEVADVDSWNTLIVGCAKNGYQLESLEAFNLMRSSSNVNADSITLVSVLSASGSLDFMFHGMSVHGFITKMLIGSDLQVRNSLLTMYCRFGDTESAELIFHTSPCKNLCSWNCMISGFAQNKVGIRALEVFRRLQFEPNEITIVGILTACTQLGALRRGREINGYAFRSGLHPNAFISAALVDMYSKCGRLETATQVFKTSMEKSIASWNSMISAYGIHGYGKKAIELFHEMCESDTRATKSTFISLLSACSYSGLIDEGLWLYNQMSEEYGLTPTPEHHVCMVDMLGRAGRLAEAYEFIKQIPTKPAPGVWGALLSACKDHNNLEMGESIAEHLFFLEPENVGYYVSLSNMYAAAARWSDAVEVRRMLQDRGLKKPPGCSLLDVRVG